MFTHYFFLVLQTTDGFSLIVSLCVSLSMPLSLFYYADLCSRRVRKWAVHPGHHQHSFPSFFLQWYQHSFRPALPPPFFFHLVYNFLLPPSVCAGFMLQAYYSATKWFSKPQVSGDSSSGLGWNPCYILMIWSHQCFKLSTIKPNFQQRISPTQKLDFVGQRVQCASIKIV